MKMAKTRSNRIVGTCLFIGISSNLNSSMDGEEAGHYTELERNAASGLADRGD
jgi:hypothetical protein